MAQKRRREPTDTHICFCYNLVKLRKFKRLTQDELGARMVPPVHRVVIADLERGRIAPTIDTIDRLAKAFRLPAVLFLDDSMETSMSRLIVRYKNLRETYEYPAKRMALKKLGIRYVRHLGSQGEDENKAEGA